MSCNVNPKTKKEFKTLVEKGGVYLIAYGPFDKPNQTGQVCIEGPQYPQPHKWYATAKVVDGKVVSVK